MARTITHDVAGAAENDNAGKGAFSVAPARHGSDLAAAFPTRHRFDEELAQLEARLCAMGRATAAMLEDATRALTTNDTTLARSVVERDAQIDSLDRAVEESALLMVARQQPVATDLRLLGAALKMTTDIERIGDHAVNVARVALRLEAAELRYIPLVDMERLSDTAVWMVRAVTEALAARDLNAARAVIRRDDELDVLYKEAQRDLRNAMQHDAAALAYGGEAPKTVLLASHLLFVAHYLERIGDHCTSVAERVEYQLTGRSPLPRASYATTEDGAEEEHDIA